MSDFKDRLLGEQAQLTERLQKLREFQSTENFNELPAIQQSLLNIQANAMATYNQALTERLYWLDPVGASQA